MTFKTHAQIICLLTLIGCSNLAFCGEIDEAVQKLDDIAAKITNLKTEQFKFDRDEYKELAALKMTIKAIVKNDQKARSSIVRKIEEYANTKRAVSMKDPDSPEWLRSYMAFDVLIEILQDAGEDELIRVSLEIMGRQSVDMLFRDHLFNWLFFGHRIWLKATNVSKLPEYDHKIEPLAKKYLKEKKIGNNRLHSGFEHRLLDSLAGYNGFGLSLPPLNRDYGMRYLKKVISSDVLLMEKLWYYEKLAEYSSSDRPKLVELLKDEVANKGEAYFVRARYAKTLYNMGEIDLKTVKTLEKKAIENRTIQIKIPNKNVEKEE